MAEKEKIKKSGKNTEEVEVEVFVQNKALPKKSLVVPRGTSLKDALEKLSREHGLNINEFTVVFNDRIISIEGGELKENPLITENATLNLLRRVIGGCSL